MAVIDVDLLAESKSRYLAYALSVVSSRALPDVRDGLKPVQRRILFAMDSDLSIGPDRNHRKSAAVVGEVLAKYHPHGDAACYEAMVRMAQGFSLRYPLVDGQGNFGSLDGDSAAAYRYTEARLTRFAIEVIGDIKDEAVAFRENFDQTTKEPVVFPSRLPNLLVNGSSGIAVGLATSIPPHNLREVINGLLVLLRDPTVSDALLFAEIKAPDFPTACTIVNSKEELRSIYETGRGAIRMRGNYVIEQHKKGRSLIVVNSIPYGIDKSILIEKIADIIISRKVPQLEDIRDESTSEVRIVMELASGADAFVVMSYLYKHTQLQTNFNVNLTALVPAEDSAALRPERLSLRGILSEFLKFRTSVSKSKLEFERQNLLARINVLEGLVIICDDLEIAIELIRKSKGRADAASKLATRFNLSDEQAYFIVDLRLYQLAQTSIDEVVIELKDRRRRIAEISDILVNPVSLNNLIAADLERIADTYGDERKSAIDYEAEEMEFDANAYVQHEDVYVIVTKDGWIKRIRASNDPNGIRSNGTRLREGDSLFFVEQTSTANYLQVYTNLGNVYTCKVYDLLNTTGFGEPIQKIFRFENGEQIVCCRLQSCNPSNEMINSDGELLIVYTKRGFGFCLHESKVFGTKESEGTKRLSKGGKRLVRLIEGDSLVGIVTVKNDVLLLVSERGYGLLIMSSEVPVLNGAGKGVVLQKMPDDDYLKLVIPVDRSSKVQILLDGDETREVSIESLPMMVRAKRGNKLFKSGKKIIKAE